MSDWTIKFSCWVRNMNLSFMHLIRGRYRRCFWTACDLIFLTVRYFQMMEFDANAPKQWNSDVRFRHLPRLCFLCHLISYTYIFLGEIMSCPIHYTFFQLVIVLASNVGKLWKKLTHYLIIVNLPVLLTENGTRTIFLKNLLMLSLFGKYVVLVELFQDSFRKISLSRTGLLVISLLTWKA